MSENLTAEDRQHEAARDAVYDAGHGTVRIDLKETDSMVQVVIATCSCGWVSRAHAISPDEPFQGYTAREAGREVGDHGTEATIASLRCQLEAAEREIKRLTRLCKPVEQRRVGGGRGHRVLSLVMARVAVLTGTGWVAVLEKADALAEAVGDMDHARDCRHYSSIGCNCARAALAAYQEARK